MPEKLFIVIERLGGHDRVQGPVKESEMQPLIDEMMKDVDHTTEDDDFTIYEIKPAEFKLQITTTGKLVPIK